MIHTVWSIVLTVLLATFGTLMLAALGREHAANDAARAEQAKSHAVLADEMRALAWCSATGNRMPNVPSPEPRAVRPADLVESFCFSSYHAGAEVLLPIRVGSVDGNSVGWYLGIAERPAAIECRFSDKPRVKVGEMVWIVGTCRGRRDDGHRREHPKVTFAVVVEDCRVVEGDK